MGHAGQEYISHAESGLVRICNFWGLDKVFRNKIPDLASRLIGPVLTRQCLQNEGAKQDVVRVQLGKFSQVSCLNQLYN